MATGSVGPVSEGPGSVVIPSCTMDETAVTLKVIICQVRWMKQQ